MIIGFILFSSIHHLFSPISLGTHRPDYKHGPPHHCKGPSSGKIGFRKQKQYFKPLYLADPAGGEPDTDGHQNQPAEQVVIVNAEHVQPLGCEEAGCHHHGLGGVVGKDKCF